MIFSSFMKNLCFCKISKCTSKALPVFLTSFFLLFILSCKSDAAIVNGEGVPREVDGPGGPHIVTSLGSSEDSDSGSISETSSNLPSHTERKKKERKANPAEPELPVDVSEPLPQQPPQKSNNMVKYIVVGLVTILVGLGAVIGISKSKGR